MLYAYHEQVRGSLERSLNVLAEDLIYHKLYQNEHSDIHTELHLLNVPGALHEGLTFAYHPHKPKPVIGTGVIKHLPDGRYLTVYSSHKQINAKTYTLTKELFMLFTILLILSALAFALLFKKRFAAQDQLR